MDTRMMEVCAGFFAISYGMQAAQPGWSQFQTLLAIKDSAFEWGIGLTVLGLLCALFAFSRFYRVRFVVNAGLFCMWGAIVMLFAQYREAGIPMFNGMILMVVSLAVMWTIARHEKQSRTCV